MRFELLETAQCERDLAALGEPFQLPANANYFEIECQTGTYIRSLAKILAMRLGTVATADVIIRTQVGKFSLENACLLDRVQINDLQPIEEF